MGVRF